MLSAETPAEIALLHAAKAYSANDIKPSSYCTSVFRRSGRTRDFIGAAGSRQALSLSERGRVH